MIGFPTSAQLRGGPTSHLTPRFTLDTRGNMAGPDPEENT